jgi:hypothetical protein
MLCDKYKDALIEVAGGAAVPDSLYEHVGACARCRAMLDAQQRVFAMVDDGLRSRANVGVPANFEHRVRAALEIEASAPGTRFPSVLGFASMAAAAALVLAIFLTHNVGQPGKETPGGRDEAAELSASHSTTVHGSGEELQPSRRGSLHSHGSLNGGRRLNRVAVEGRTVEVLVPSGQEELLVKYMEGLAARKPRVTITAGLQPETDQKPIEVSPVEISALVVRPLPDLSSN